MSFVIFKRPCALHYKYTLESLALRISCFNRYILLNFQSAKYDFVVMQVYSCRAAQEEKEREKEREGDSCLDFIVDKTQSYHAVVQPAPDTMALSDCDVVASHVTYNTILCSSAVSHCLSYYSPILPIVTYSLNTQYIYIFICISGRPSHHLGC